MIGAPDQSSTPTAPEVGRQEESSGGGSRAWPWVAFAVAALLLMDVVGLTWVGIIAPVGAVALVLVQRASPPRGVSWVHRRIDVEDLVVVAATYLLVVALFWVAFQGFGTGQVAGLFLTFATGLLLGVVVPVVYMVWRRGRSLADLGIGTHRMRETVALGVLLAAVQFGMTLWGYDLPSAPVDWVPLLVMSLVIGLFEAVFFRGFIQGRLEASVGTVGGVAGAATLYSLYHVGYGMGATEMVFLLGLGVIYAVAYRLVGNVLVLWPLLTPLGAFFNNLDSGDIELPWASIAGFADVAALMVAALWLAHRHEVRRARARRPDAAGQGSAEKAGA